MKTLNLKAVITFAIAGLFLMGCGSSSDKTSVRAGGRNAANNGDVVAPNQAGYQSWSGIVYGSPQNLFQDATDDLVSSFMDVNDLGTVSGGYNQTTGVRFQSQLSTSVLTNNLQALQIQGGSMDLLIFDSAALNGAESIVMTFDFVGSQMNGSWLDLHFKSTEGYSNVAIQGYISGNDFVGEIRFTNKTSYSGSSLKSWALWGGTRIPKCQIFRCN